jgi:SAM-dependent methyltransferase
MGTADHDRRSLRAAWDENAEAWLRWARSPELDHAFWHLNLPTLIGLLPPPGEITLDVGCGEGRVARALNELGHVVVGVESSPALARAATEGDPAFEVHIADAAAMPLPDSLADLAVASLSLMNMDDMRGVVSEIARVLRPESCFCFSILHPINSWGDAEAGYFETVRYDEQLDRGGARMILHDTHRPLSDYSVRSRRRASSWSGLWSRCPTPPISRHFPMPRGGLSARDSYVSAHGLADKRPALGVSP